MVNFRQLLYIINKKDALAKRADHGERADAQADGSREILRFLRDIGCRDDSEKGPR